MPTAHVRKAHVKRIYRLNDDGTIDSDVWVDVLRIDAMTVDGRGFRDQVSGLLTNSVFKWLDDGRTPGGDVRHENVNRDRRTTELTVANPELPETDKSTDVLLYVVQRSRIKFPHSPVSDVLDARAGQLLTWVFDNVPADGSAPGTPPRRPSTRKVKVVRVVNNDLAGLDMTDTVSWGDYVAALNRGVVDKNQYLDAEVVDNFHLDFRQGQGGAEYQVSEYVIQNEAVIQQIDAGGEGFTSAGAPTKKYRLDPIETIVNVHWATDYLQVVLKIDRPSESMDPRYFAYITGPSETTDIFTFTGGLNQAILTVAGLPPASGADVEDVSVLYPDALPFLEGNTDGGGGCSIFQSGSLGATVQQYVNSEWFTDPPVPAYVKHLDFSDTMFTTTDSLGGHIDNWKVTTAVVPNVVNPVNPHITNTNALIYLNCQKL